MRTLQWLLMSLLVFGLCGSAHAELVETLFSHDGTPPSPAEELQCITTDSLVAVNLPVLPSNGDYVLSAISHAPESPPYMSDFHLYFEHNFPEYEGRTDLFIQCSFQYLNTTERQLHVSYVGGEGPGIYAAAPAHMTEWAYAESALEPFDHVWVMLSVPWGRLGEEFYLGYFLLDNVEIKIYDAAGVPVGKVSVGELKASY